MIKIKRFIACAVSVAALLLLPLVNFAQTKIENQPPANETAKEIKPGQTGKLSIAPGSDFKSSSVNPIAKVSFYLLDQDLEVILQQSGMSPVISLGKAVRTRRDFKQTELYAMLNYVGGIGENKNDPVELKVAETAIKPHVVASATADANGNAAFTAIKTGKYYLIGVSGAKFQSIVWNLPIEIKTQTEKVILDKKNAAAIFPN